MVAVKNSFVIDDDNIKEVWICKSYHYLRRWDVIPFLAVYTALAGIGYWSDDYTYILLGVIPILLISQILLFFFSRWSVLARFYIGYYRVTSIDKSDHVLAFNAKLGGGKILPLYRRPSSNLREVSIAGKRFAYSCEFFEFDKVKYEYDAVANSFSRLSFPVQIGVTQVLQSSGHANEAMVNFSFAKWGFNYFDIPVPMFLDLYAEHICAPFFVFQVLCLFLWSMDDYWYYSMFTLLMLLFFEGMLCKQRQNSLFMLRNMRRPPQQIVALRCGHWFPVSSDELIPGDVIILNSHHDARGDNQTEAIIPCDGVLLSGSCVVNEAMLTGESVPQVKEALVHDNTVTSMLDIGTEFNSEAGSIWKSHVLLGGTVMLQHASSPGEKLPISGCKVLVLRTGFGTTQGMLMRKILFAANRNTKQAIETFYFIGILVVFAVMASATVLYHGYGDESRNKFKLFLHCVMIITSVIPPELPMELSLAVTTSLAALGKCLVYCTEPDRIELAGKVSVMCFDKTGTLTKDRMMLEGLICDQDKPILQHFSDPSTTSGNSGEVINASDIKNAASLAARVIMASCHSLAIQGNNGNNFVGDPLEVASFAASGLFFETSATQLSLPTFVSSRSNIKVVTLHRYPFSSGLKRMSVLVEVSKLSSDSAAGMIYGAPSSSGAGSHTPRQWMVVSKGAPEILAPKLKKCPANYHQISAQYMAKGKRVLAIACKVVSEVEAKGSASSSSGNRSASSTNYVYPREHAERDLEFAGFLVFDCELKSDSKSVIRELVHSDHRVMMITGDNPLTAIDVAERLDLMKKSLPTLIYAYGNNAAITSNVAPILQWKYSDPQAESKEITCTLDEIVKLSTANNLCITGDGILHLMDVISQCNLGSITGVDGKTISNASNRYRIAYVLRKVVPYVTIYARVTPGQKEHIIATLNDCGHYTLMCGDGTNDVGALKAAHIGVSIVNNPDFETSIENSLRAKQTDAAGTGKKSKSANSKDRMARAVAELNAQFEDHSVVKLGDASIASPFTSRRTSIDSVLTVVRQGRATLVTTIQIFKILALNCLISAYFMSTLYLKGLKHGDTQMTVSGLASALLFFFLSLSKPLHRIDPSRPQTSVFQRSVAVSVAGQFVVHLICLVTTLRLCESYTNADDPSLAVDGKFQPNIINTAMYLLGMAMLVNNFVVNYCGYPFVQSIQDNVWLFRSIAGVYSGIVIVIGGQVEPLNDLLQLIPFPGAEFQASLLGILVFNFIASYFIERSCRKYL